MSIKWFILVLLLVLISVESREINSQEKQYCGTRLSEMLAFVCKGKYNTLFQDPNRTRRHIPSGFPFKTKENTFTFLKTLRRKRGVSDECCAKSCTLNELTAYCQKN